MAKLLFAMVTCVCMVVVWTEPPATNLWPTTGGPKGIPGIPGVPGVPSSDDTPLPGAAFQNQVKYKESCGNARNKKCMLKAIKETDKKYKEGEQATVLLQWAEYTEEEPTGKLTEQDKKNACKAAAKCKCKIHQDWCD